MTSPGFGGEKPCTAPCMRCGELVQNDDDFCPGCGTLRAERVDCANHSGIGAEGVCIICMTPCCRACGTFTHGLFLCNAHASCEIYEGMVRVFGALDDVTCQFAKSSLEQSGLHAILYCPNQPFGSGRFVSTIYSGHGDYKGHLAGEIKVMVPCQEFERAKEILAELDLPGGP